MDTRTLALALFVLLLGGLGFLGSSSHSPPTLERREFHDSFGILRTFPEQAETATDRQSFKSAELVEPRARFKNLQLVARGSNRLWVLSTGQQLCVAQPKGASCAPKKVSIEKGVLLGTFRPPTKRKPFPHNFLLQGVVPDDVEKVLVVIGKDRQLVVDVKRNVFSVERDDPVHLKRLLRG